MRIKLFYLTALVGLLSSCVVDEYGETKIATWVWVALFILVLIVILTSITSNKEFKTTAEALNKRGQKLADFRIIGKYVGGHPHFDKEINNVSVRDDKDTLCFYEQTSSVAMPYHRFDIQKERIKSIELEDASTIEKKITVGRIFLVGLFALGWKKKKKNELAFVTINWNDGKFDHATIFVCEGKDAMQRANAGRNHLIKLAN